MAAPIHKAVLFLCPLVEEKVKEQLEAAKPEPVIEEVVSTRVAHSQIMLLPSLESLFPPCFLPCLSAFFYLCALSRHLPLEAGPWP